MKIVQNLPAAVRKRFVQYVGNTLSPTDQINSELNTSIPFLPLTQLTQILESVELQKRVSLTAKQLEELADIDKAFWRDFKSTEKRAGKSMAVYAEGLQAIQIKVTSDVLSKSQLTQLCRFFAFEGFLNNFASPFSRPKVVEFLDFSNAELAANSERVAQEKSLIRQRVQELDQQVFTKLASVFSQETRSRLETLFRGVWKIAL